MCTKSKFKIKLEQIKDIQVGEKNLQLLFEVTKKIQEDEEGLLCRIADQTGTSEAYFTQPIKKYIQQAKVYTAKNAIAKVVNEHIRIQLDKEKGNMVKQPVLIYFKDHTFDLSKAAWAKKKIEEPAKQKIIKEQKKLDILTIKQQKINQNQLKKQIKEKEMIEKKSSSHIQRNKQQQTSQSNNIRSYKYKIQEEPRQQNHYKDQFQKYNNKYTAKRYVEKKYYKEEISENQYGVIYSKLNEIKQSHRGQLINVKAFTDEGIITQKFGKKYQQFVLSDSTGSVYGSFYINSRLQTKTFYSFTNMKVQINKEGEILLLETKNSEIKMTGSKFKINRNTIRL